MSSRVKFGVLLVSSVVVVYSVVGGMMGRVRAQNGVFPQLSIFTELFQTYPQITILTEVITRIQNDYVDEPSIPEAMEAAIRGMVERVDPNGGYLSPESVQFHEDYDPLSSAGVGVILGRRFDFPAIIQAIPGGPADMAGLGTGDAIEGIGGESLREYNLVEVRQLLAGEPGTTVELNVIRRAAAATETITVTRAVVEVPAVDARVLEENVGYLQIPIMGPGTVAEVRAELDGLIAEGASSLVLDLRSSAGGGETEATALANLFIASGTLGYFEGQTVARETFSANPDAAFPELPLAVLIDEGTAGASEIAAGAIRDNSRGDVVGVRTFGLASIQRLHPLDDGWALLLSVANYYTPNGDEIRTAGVQPTVEISRNAQTPDPLAVPDPDDDPDADLQLERAIELLTGVAEDSAGAADAA